MASERLSSAIWIRMRMAWPLARLHSPREQAGLSEPQAQDLQSVKSQLPEELPFPHHPVLVPVGQQFGGEHFDHVVDGFLLGEPDRRIDDSRGDLPGLAEVDRDAARQLERLTEGFDGLLAWIGKAPQGRPEAPSGPALGGVRPQDTRELRPMDLMASEGQEGQEALGALRQGHAAVGPDKPEPIEQAQQRLDPLFGWGRANHYVAGEDSPHRTSLFGANPNTLPIPGARPILSVRSSQSPARPGSSLAPGRRGRIFTR